MVENKRIILLGHTNGVLAVIEMVGGTHSVTQELNIILFIEPKQRSTLEINFFPMLSTSKRERSSYFNNEEKKKKKKKSLYKNMHFSLKINLLYTKYSLPSTGLFPQIFR